MTIKIEGLLGKGSYGKVYKGTLNNKVVAIKEFINNDNDEFDNEIDILEKLKHRNIIKIIKYIIKGERKSIIMECLRMSLCNYIDLKQSKKEVFDKQLRKSYLYQLLLGLKHCKDNNVLHRDLKPSNIVIDNDGLLKIIDFGCSKNNFDPNKRNSFDVSTLWYKPPEMLLMFDKYDYSVDIWAAGCIFIEMITLSPIFKAESEYEQLFKIFSVLGVPTEEEWAGVTKLDGFSKFPNWKENILKSKIPKDMFDDVEFDLINKMLVCCPLKRISIEDSLKHPYFDDLDKSSLE